MPASPTKKMHLGSTAAFGNEPTSQSLMTHGKLKMTHLKLVEQKFAHVEDPLTRGAVFNHQLRARPAGRTSSLSHE